MFWDVCVYIADSPCLKVNLKDRVRWLRGEMLPKSPSVYYVFIKSQFKDLSIYLFIFDMSKLTAV